MAQTYHNQNGNAVIIQLYERARYMRRGCGPRLDEKQKVLVKQIWGQWVRPDLTQAGIAVLMRMFQQYPSTLALFDLETGKAGVADMAGMEKNSRLIFLAYRVFAIFNRVVENLDSLENVAPLLTQVGGRHSSKGYNMHPEYITYLGEAVIYCGRAALPSLTSEGETALANMFDWIHEQMREGMNRHDTGSNRI